MTEIPAGWYTDPEQAGQLRYWDGLQWTEHRAPEPTTDNVSSGDAMAVVSGAFSMFGANWVQLLIIAALATVFLIGGLILMIIGVAISLDPSLWDIIDRVTSSNYNPEFDPVDKAFEDSIRWTWNGGAVLLLVGYATLIVGMWGGMAAGILHLASVRAGRPRGAVSCFGMMLRRLPRWLGIGLLWGLGSAILLIVPILLYVLAARTTSALFLLLVPATIAAVIFVWPFAQLSGTALVLAPRGTPPFRHVVSLVRVNWSGIAIRCLLINVFLILLQIASNVVGIIPLLGLLAVIPASFFVTSYQIASGVLLYEYAGGSVDPEIPEVNAPSAVGYAGNS